VIVPPLTFIATAEAVRTAGATPVFADVDPATLTVCPRAVERAATPRTRAVVAVHLYGNPCPVDALEAVCGRIGAVLVEDSAQAIGASYRGRRCGALARVAAFSCFPSKNLGACGDAGFLSTDDDDLAGRARMIRVHGSSSKYRHEVRGLNARLDTLQAAFLRVKLRRLDRWVEARRRVAGRYREAFADLPLGLQRETDGALHAYHLFTVQVEDREALARRLADRGIETAMHYPIPLHLQPVFAPMDLGPGSFPVSEAAAARVLSIPLYPELTDGQIGEVIAGVRSHFGR
jgi:dTDP-4-amino-4,6-dideoxygalactose transaminase